ncbi:MAG: hypothetical protein K8H89_13645, partial [Flavobacteriales bacterium]|nr:hypothetical protein [Flavobacteriales bacterium]
MNRILLATCLLAPLMLNAQSISPSVIGSAGSSGTVGGTTVSWTVGETAVTTLDNGSNILTQGFHQPEALGGCLGNQVVVAINTDGNPDQITWEITNSGNTVIASGGPTAGQSNMLVSQTVCLGTTPSSACYGFRLMDSFGDGLNGVGNWQLRTTDGKVLLGDDFAGGSDSPSLTPQYGGYGSHHGFCLPEGPASIAPSECGIMNNT